LFFIVNICSPIFEHSTPMSYSSFTHYILAINHSWRRTHHKSHRRHEQTIGDQLCDGLQGNESCDATSHAWALPCSYISCQK
jgi:hypothetical protein